MRIPWKVLLLAIFLILVPACRKTDVERAVEERKEFQEKVEKASDVTLYRLLKLAARSKGAQNRPAEIAVLEARIGSLSETSGMAQWMEVLGLFHQTKHLLAKLDEDTFPLLWGTYAKASLPVPWYDNGAEHLGMTILLWAISRHGEDYSGPITYELGRAIPGPTWPPEITLGLSLIRGAVYSSHDYPYAADEEYSGYIHGMAAIQPGRLIWVDPGSRKDAYSILLSAGYFLRAWNRMTMDRDEAAAQDLESALKLVEGMVGENELTLWGSAFVDYQRGGYSEVGKKLGKLAESPHLDSQLRVELWGYAQKLQEGKKVPQAFEKGRSGLLIVRALIARAGGLERILERLVGEEPARRMIGQVMIGVRVHSFATDPKSVAGKVMHTGDSFLKRLK